MKWDKYFAGDGGFDIYKHIFDAMEIWDAHTHIGVDEDGKRVTPEDLIKQMDEANVSKAVAFPLNDPKRGRTFHGPNEQILKAYQKYPDRIIPFFRLDPKGSWKREFALRSSQDFQGIKLHPRSQDFDIMSADAMEIYDRAEEANLPILVHTGFGLDDAAKNLDRICRRYPNLRLILGHGVFIDIQKAFKFLKGHPGIAFEISAVLPFDIYEMLEHLPSKQIMFGSDLPYYDIDYYVEMLVHLAVIHDTPMRDLENIFCNNIKRWLQ